MTTTARLPAAGPEKTTEAGASTGIGVATRGTGHPPPAGRGVPPTPSTRGILIAAGAAHPAAKAAGGATSSHIGRSLPRILLNYEG